MNLAREPSRIQEVLGTDLFARLTEPSGDPTAPPDDHGGAAARADWLAGVVSDLSGTYAPAGIRAWFDRPRAQLEGRSPCEVLGDGWDPRSPDAEKVAALARSSTGPGTAT